MDIEEWLIMFGNESPLERDLKVRFQRAVREAGIREKDYSNWIEYSKAVRERIQSIGVNMNEKRMSNLTIGIEELLLGEHKEESIKDIQQQVIKLLRDNNIRREDHKSDNEYLKEAGEFLDNQFKEDE
jgi:hypothetical protein